MHCANSSINFSVTDTNSSRTSEAALWPSTYISPLSNSTPCIRKDRISSKSLMRLSICLWKPSIRSEERFSRNAETDLVCRLLLEKKNVSNGSLVLPYIAITAASACDKEPVLQQLQSGLRAP